MRSGRITMAKYNSTARSRLLALIEPEPFSGCWLWIGCLDPKGYGQFNRNGLDRIGAHRAAYELLQETVPDDLELDHLCRVHSCVNPRHLEPVTHLENVRRGAGNAASLAERKARTHCSHGHEYTPNNTRMYRGHRNCEECARLYRKAMGFMKYVVVS